MSSFVQVENEEKYWKYNHEFKYRKLTDQQKILLKSLPVIRY